MAKRDPEKTARNKIISEMTEKLQSMIPEVLRLTGLPNEHSWHGKIGGKYAEYIDIKDAVITSPEHFVSLWLEGYKNYLDDLDNLSSKHWDNFRLIKRYKLLQEYLYIFLQRTYLRNYESLSKKRPKVEEAEIYIGQNNAEYGILITPRYRNGKWENDKSEIRHFKNNYWSVGHILETGLVMPNKNSKIEFVSIKEYLRFFKDVIVRNSGSKYEYEIAELYCDYVNNSENPEKVPLLIPEFRYNGLQKNHIYRLDLCIIDPYELNKIGFELSPWSSHGYLRKTNSLSQKEINEMAKDNFQKEIKKHRLFFKQHGIFILIFTDDDLADCPKIFAEISNYLKPKKIGQQLKFHIINNFFK